MSVILVYFLSVWSLLVLALSLWVLSRFPSFYHSLRGFEVRVRVGMAVCLFVLASCLRCDPTLKI